MFARSIVVSSFLGFALAQFPPEPKGITLLRSKFHENVTISYKEPGICETTPGVKSYAGHVHLPPGTLDDGSGEKQDYPINTFFWFFEARETPEHAPLAIWLNGGPGGSSLVGALEELGPCFVTADSKNTYLNPWSWNNDVNILFLDQPNQVGFSYDVPSNGTLMPVEDGPGQYSLQPVLQNFTTGVPAPNLTHHPGTFSSLRASSTQNSTASAAHALWHFMQTWFFEFPHYKPHDGRISLWAESYGGHYGPGIFRFFQQQNDKIRDGSSKEKGAKYLNLDTLGIVNGVIDVAVQGDSLIQMAYNNTYGIKVISEAQFNELSDFWSKPGGCKDTILDCQAALQELEVTIPRVSRESAVADICEDAQECLFAAVETYLESGAAGGYDIAHPAADPFPPPVKLGYLNQESILSALGARVNFTDTSLAVAEGFTQTFDFMRGGFLDALAYLLDSGVKVHMMYGDRDFACNWIGGEKASLAVPYSKAAEFAAAGYAPLLTPDGIKGMTRQHGNFSFTRVFQAGHEVPSYQPVAAHEIFVRATFNKDIATGSMPVTDGLSSVGPSDVWFIKNIPPKRPKPRCYILKPMSCIPEVWATVLNGTAVVKDCQQSEFADVAFRLLRYRCVKTLPAEFQCHDILENGAANSNTSCTAQLAHEAIHGCCRRFITRLALRLRGEVLGIENDALSEA
ncbi:serine carboxypeptidase [Xylariales sp. PMI_506]|nr:serine carboxypeptidase [Xylariales sp. PMI_506]